MDGDKFINQTKTKTFYQNVGLSENDNNFFLQPELTTFANKSNADQVRHLNDLDSNILQEGAYKDVSDEVFKLEYKISRIENELKQINNDMIMAQEILDYEELERLNNRKNQLETDLSLLTDLYNEASISAKISGGLTTKIKDKSTNIIQSFKEHMECFLSKLPGKISSVIMIKSSLTKLENINKSVDELMRCQYPYGEAGIKYEQLSRYIARANTLQSEIYKFMK